MREKTSWQDTKPIKCLKEKKDKFNKVDNSTKLSRRIS